MGLQQAGVEVIGAFENWQPAIDIYKCNFTHPILNTDLSDVDSAVEMISAFGPDLIAGGPPCQDFSSAGKRNEGLGRADLTIAFAKIVTAVGPEWFLMENVERAAKSKAFGEAKQILAKSYGLTQVILDASLCGVPQKRKRMFLIGKKETPDNFLTSQLIGGLASKGLSIREFLGDKINTQYYYRHARSYARRGIFSIDEPSPTIRGVNRPVPPNYKFHSGDATHDLSRVRPLTYLERGLIQTFPEDFYWGSSNKSNVEQIIGNAVPVKLGLYVGNKIMEYQKSQQYKLELVF